MMSETNFKVGDRVSLKQAVDVHIDGGLTQICPGEVGIIDWTNGKEMEVYFGDYVRLELYASQVERVETTDPRTAFLQELKELLTKYNVTIDGGCLGWDNEDPFVSFDSKDFKLAYCEEYCSKFKFPLTPDNIMDYDKK